MRILERRQGALVFTGLIALGALIGGVFWPLPARWPWVLTSGIGASLFVLLLAAGVRAQTKAADAERFMRKFLAVRDLANSPLQSIEATLAVLRIRHPDSGAQWDRLERQIDRLRKLSTVLSRYEPETWTVTDRSFDPLEVLQQLEDSPTKEFDRLFLVGPEHGVAQQRRRRALSKLEQLLRFTSFGLEHSPVCAFWLGQDGRLVYVNQASCDSLGYSRSELLGMHISSFAPRVSREEWPTRFQAIRRQRPSPYPSLHRRKDGTLVPVEITASYAELNGRGYLLGFARETAARVSDKNGAAGKRELPKVGAPAR